MTRSVGSAALMLVALCGCDAPATPAPVPETAPTPGGPVVMGAPVPPLPGVGPGGAEGRPARRQAVLDLLSDGQSAAALPLIDSAPGRSFVPEPADVLTPRVYPPVPAPPTVEQGKHTVVGPLSKDIIRRIVRAHINELRYCYQQGLARSPDRGGRVVIDYQILGTGKVGDSKLKKSTLPDAAVGTCMVEATRRWTYPRPDRGATVTVSYPFVLAPPGKAHR
jgi:TonB family protein